MLDTPGILPMSYDNQQKAINLALLGSVREDILPKTDLVEELLKILKAKYPNALEGRFGIKEISSLQNVLKEISQKRGLITSKGEADFAKSENLLLKEFKDGLLGRMTLEWL